MTLGAPRHHHTFAEYLELEEIAGVRHEFYAGEIYAMAGETPEHAAVAAAITGALTRQLASKPCTGSAGPALGDRVRVGSG